MEKINGFSIQKKGSRLYAVKRVGSKVLWILLGDNLDGAAEKIAAYCEKRGINPNRKAEKKADLIDKIKTLEDQVIELTKRVSVLESRPKVLEDEGLVSKVVQARSEARPKEDKKIPPVIRQSATDDGKERILGFLIKYTGKYWIANRGKNNVHLGKEKPSQIEIEQKIAAYCEKRGIILGESK